MLSRIFGIVTYIYLCICFHPLKNVCFSNIFSYKLFSGECWCWHVGYIVASVLAKQDLWSTAYSAAFLLYPHQICVCKLMTGQRWRWPKRGTMTTWGPLPHTHALRTWPKLLLNDVRIVWLCKILKEMRLNVSTSKFLFR